MNISMKNQLLIWLAAILLAFSTILKYFRRVHPDSFGIYENAMYISFILIFIIGVVFFHKRSTFDEMWGNNIPLALLFVITLLVSITTFVFHSPNFLRMLHTYLSSFFLLLLLYLGIKTISPKVFNVITHKYYAIAFAVGILFMSMELFGVTVDKRLINENTVGLLLVPFLIYLFIKAKGLYLKLLIYTIGAILIYISDAHTSLIIFILLPVFIMIIKKIKNPRLFYSIYILSGILVTFIIANINSELITSLLTNRDILWEKYFDHVTSSIQHFLFGTGQWVIKLEDPLLHGLHAHNAYLNILNYSGVFVLVLYLCLIIFSNRKRVNTFTVSDGVLFFMVTFQFAESSVPFFNFFFPSVIFYINIFMNRFSEEIKDY